MFRLIAGALLIAVFSIGVSAQSFTAAKITASHPGAQRETFRYEPAFGFFSSTNHTINECIAFAYGIPPGLISGGPEWAASERYDISALMPAHVASEEQRAVMFQTLLMQRFGLTFHREMKEARVYALVNTRSILQQSSAAEDAPASLTIEPRSKWVAEIPARGAGIVEFVSLLQRFITDRPVIDRTGLIGAYDFDLRVAVDGTRLKQTSEPMPEYSTAPDVFEAVQQLGLKLEPRNAPVEILVIDTLMRP